jgi:hypothetical protein
MCLFGFLCFNQVYNILADYMFQVYVSIMFMYKVYVFVSRPCISIMAMFQVVGMFWYQSSPCFGSRFLNHFMIYSLFLGV